MISALPHKYEFDVCSSVRISILHYIGIIYIYIYNYSIEHSSLDWYIYIYIQRTALAGKWVFSSKIRYFLFDRLLNLIKHIGFHPINTFYNMLTQNAV